MVDSREPPAGVDELERRFEREAGRLIDTARRACLRLLPWAAQEHDTIIQETLERALDNLRAGKLDATDLDLAGYVYGVARNCIREARRRLYLAEARSCALPVDDDIIASLAEADPETDGVGSPGELPEDVARGRLLDVLRYYVVHVFSTATPAKRRQAFRDTYIVARHYLRGVPLTRLAQELDLTTRACQYALDRTTQRLVRLFDAESGETRSFVDNSESFADVSQLTDFLRDVIARGP